MCGAGGRSRRSPVRGRRRRRARTRRPRADGARNLLEVIAQPPAVLEDRAAPAAGALCGLELMLQQMGQQDDQVVLDRLLVAPRHRLDLFDQVGQIESRANRPSRSSAACCSSQRQKSRSYSVCGSPAKAFARATPRLPARCLAALHHRADLPGHELVVAEPERLALGLLARGDREDQVEDLLGPSARCWPRRRGSSPQLMSMSSSMRRYIGGVGGELDRRRGLAAEGRAAAGGEADQVARRRRPGRSPRPGRSRACP